MKRSLLFIPDISGFTQFIRSTEVAHSQHVIAELLEVLIDSNISGLELAEIEGDALFFYKERDTLSQETLLAQIEHMFVEFYSHLKLLETNRICPCNACATAPKLELKVVVHSGDFQFIEVKGNRKPFGQPVIEAHRMLKNSIESDNYIMISRSLADGIGLNPNYVSLLHSFKEGKDEYDGKALDYIFSIVDPVKLKLKPAHEVINMNFDKEPDFSITKEFHVSAERCFETVSNYRFRHEWVSGVDSYEFNENEVTRKGTEHACIIDGKRLDFVAVTAEGEPGQLVYGEITKSPALVDELIQMFYIDPISETNSRVRLDVFARAKSPLKKLALALLVRRFIKKNSVKAMSALEAYFLRVPK